MYYREFLLCEGWQIIQRGDMEDSTKEYIRLLLNYAKELYAENQALKFILRNARSPEVRSDWEPALVLLLQSLEARQAIDAKFDPHIATIMQTLDDREAFATLLQSASKGLPK
jgi:hypothetical protein